MTRAHYAIALLCSAVAASASAQQVWREYPSIERGWAAGADSPADLSDLGEFVVGRLMFPQTRRRSVFS